MKQFKIRPDGGALTSFLWNNFEREVWSSNSERFKSFKELSTVLHLLNRALSLLTTMFGEKETFKFILRFFQGILDSLPPIDGIVTFSATPSFI